jgi:hypothetical protein
MPGAWEGIQGRPGRLGELPASQDRAQLLELVVAHPVEQLDQARQQVGPAAPDVALAAPATWKSCGKFCGKSGAGCAVSSWNIAIRPGPLRYGAGVGTG